MTTSDSEATTVMLTQTQELTVSATVINTSDSDFYIQLSGFITHRRKCKRSSSSHRQDKRSKTTQKNDTLSTKGKSSLN